jgi:hypothetical protein
MPTLFFDPQVTVDTFQRWYKRTISLEFTSCMDLQLTAQFELTTGLKINKQISIATRSEWEFFVTTGDISKIGFYIYVNHNWNPVTVLWKSKSGRIYEILDTDIDCDDIEFWFEELNVTLIHRQMFPGDKLPFRLKELSYELVVSRISMDCTFELQLKEEHLADSDEVIKLVDNYLAEFNENSEKKDRKYGVIYRWESRTEENKIIIDINLGSAGPNIFKKLLPQLSELNYLSRVEIG